MDKQQIATNLAEAIFSECGPYINSSKRTLYRGIGDDDEPQHHQRLKVNKNRIPLDSSDELTSALNALYGQTGSPVTRNNCIFTTTDERAANNYGNTFVVFPIGEYHALWNNEIDDAYLVFEKLKKLTVDAISQPFYTDLASHPLGYVEVMIMCDYYYAVEKEFYENFVLSALNELRYGFSAN